MTAKEKKNTLIGVLIAAILLLGAKKKSSGWVEVGEGSFGDFGTDGDFDSPSSKTPDYVSSIVGGQGFDVSMNGVVKEKNLENADCGCTVL